MLTLWYGRICQSAILSGALQKIIRMKPVHKCKNLRDEVKNILWEICSFCKNTQKKEREIGNWGPGTLLSVGEGKLWPAVREPVMDEGEGDKTPPRFPSDCTERRLLYTYVCENRCDVLEIFVGNCHNSAQNHTSTPIIRIGILSIDRGRQFLFR